MSRVSQIDLARRVVKAEFVELSYDHLILSTGSRTQFFSVPGAKAHSFEPKTLVQGVALRNHIRIREYMIEKTTVTANERQ